MSEVDHEPLGEISGTGVGRRCAKRGHKTVHAAIVQVTAKGQEEGRVHTVRGNGEGRRDAGTSGVQHQVMRCAVCGEALVPGGDNVLFGAAGKPLFGTHEGPCAATIRDTVQGAGRVAHSLLKRRVPWLAQGAEVVKGLLKLQGELHGD